MFDLFVIYKDINKYILITQAAHFGLFVVSNWSNTDLK